MSERAEERKGTAKRLLVAGLASSDPELWIEGAVDAIFVEIAEARTRAEEYKVAVKALIGTVDQLTDDLDRLRERVQELEQVR